MRSRQSDGSPLPRFAVCSRGGSPRRFISGGGDYVLTAGRKVLLFRGRNKSGLSPQVGPDTWIAWRRGKTAYQMRFCPPVVWSAGQRKTPQRVQNVRGVASVDEAE